MRSILLGIAFAFALMGVGAADHCVTWSTSLPEIDLCAVGLDPCNYVDHDFCQPEWCGSTWIYEESNGFAGLQRGDEVVDDTCHGLIAADTIIF